jgi:hypothetical protein
MTDNHYVNEAKALLKSLFDFQFNDFVTVRVIRILYVISVALCALLALYVLIYGLLSGVASALLALILAPVLFIFYVLAARVILELVLVLFRISSDVRKIAESKDDIR